MLIRVVFLLLIPIISFSQEAPPDRLYPVFLAPYKRIEAFIDAKGTVRMQVDTAYDVAETHMEMNEFHSGKLLVKKWRPARKSFDYFLMNMDGKIHKTFPPGMFPGPIGDKFVLARYYGNYELLDLDLNEKSTFVYNNATLEFSEGLAAVERNDSIGFIDETGELVLKPAFPKESSGPGRTNRIYFNKFINGRAQYTENGLIGFIDRNQRIVIPAKFRFVRDFCDGVAHVTLPDERSGFIDDKGKWIIGPDTNEKYGDFGNGLHAMKDAKGLYGYINKAGKYVIKPSFADAGDFVRGYASVRMPGAPEHFRRIIDTKGNIKYEGYFHFARFSDPYLILIAQEGIFAGYYALSNNFIYLDNDFKPVWTPATETRVITSVEVLQTCDPAKVKFANFSENLKSLNDLKPFLSKMNPTVLGLYPSGEDLKEVPEEIMQMTNLEELTLAFNDIETIPPSIKNLKNLKVLSLEFNNLKSLPPEIYELNLKELDLRDNKFDLKTLLEIKSKMPNTKLIFKN